MILDLGNNVRIEILETVGHASHHLSFHEHSSNKMFSGDAAGIYLNTLDVIVPTTPEPLYLDVALAAIEKMIRAKPEMLCYTHFGCAGNAVEKLEAYASQLKLWERIVRECLINGESLEVIRERIVEEDVYVNKAASFIESHPIMGQRMLLQNIQGFVSYVKRKMG
jgi:glyoxylase-like metal-dependent hydrolase (beta-lactamase superfamily II)